MIIPGRTSRIEKNVRVYIKNAYKVAFPDHIWLSFICQTQSDKVVFGIISFDVYKYLLIIYKNRFSINYIVASYEQLEILSTSLVRLTNIDESSHVNEVVIFQLCKN